MAEFKLGRFKYTWQGPWQAYGRYNPDDVVSFGAKVYVSKESHVANPNFYNDLEFYNNDIPPALTPKWELVADGVSWLGDWTPNTYYRVGDTVKLGGTVYVCIVANTSSATVVDFEDDALYWAIQLNSFNWAIDWQLATYYKLNDVVRYGGRVYRCSVSHLSSAVIDEGLESDIGSWVLISIADDWKGDWDISTRYKVNDLVKYGGNVYKCDIPHRSDADASSGLPADQAKWSLLHESTEYVGNWASATTYKVNDVVKYGAYTYKANTFHTSIAAFDSVKFDVYCPGDEYDVAWDIDTLYQIGDIVSYGGNLYVSKSIHLGLDPAISESTWELLFQGSKIRGPWALSAEYLLGDVVNRGGNLYSCLLNNQGQDPDALNDDSTTNEEYWDLLIPGIRWRGVWSPDEVYLAGDTVVWVSSSYKCLDKHVADQGNRPDDDGEVDSTLEGRYWAKITDGNRINRLKNIGDIRTFGPGADGSTIGYKALEVGSQGRALTSTSTGEVSWNYLLDSQKAYYVATFGEDIPTAGTSPQSPWRTIRYATENVTGYATIFVRTGDYDEILPIRVPAFVAIVGDELRSTMVRPGSNIISQDYTNIVIAAATRLQDFLGYVIREIAIGGLDGNLAPLTPNLSLLGEIPQDFSGTPAGLLEAGSISTLLSQFVNRVANSVPSSTTSSATYTVDTNKLNAIAQLENNLEFIKNEITIYVEQTYADSVSVALPSRWDADLDRIINALKYDLAYSGNYRTYEAATYFVNASNPAQNKASNMFLMRDGTGLRNMTLIGLEGTLGPRNIYLTRRPSAGAFVSLDPGWGPSDTTAWVGTKSPYIQNVTNFGTGCVGFKIDGDLHGGGNQTMVSNDFTQIISDGIGVWANGTGRTECVSVFSYYNHIGYLSTNGGKIRGTNGNCSYGEYGAASEGFNTAEDPIVATVNNRYYEADIYQVFADQTNGIQKLFFTNAGVNYTTGSFTITGAGQNAATVMDEFRDGAVYEARIADPGDSSSAGGSGYVFNANTAQSGTTTNIQLAGSDENLATTYRGMRVLVSRGTGAGQYGYIADFDFAGKYAYMAKESKPQVDVSQTFSGGSPANRLIIGSNTHLSVGDAIIFSGTKFGNIQDNTVYYVKTLVGTTGITISALADLSTTFSLVNGTPAVDTSMTLHCAGWEHIVPGTTIEAVLDSTTNYYVEPRVTFSSPGFTSTTSALNTSRQWTSIASSSTRFVAVALDTNIAAYSSNGTNWSNTTLPTTALWTNIEYVGGVFMAFATGGQTARSTDGTSWSSMTMPSTAEWRDVAYDGSGVWMAVAAGGTKAAKSVDGGLNWTTSTLPEGADWNSIVYGKGKFVATALSDSSTSGAAVAYTSNSGTSWTLGNLTQGSYSLAYGNNRFVALSGGYAGATEVATSFDGITWTETTISAQDWRSIVYAQGLFVAVANGWDYVATSEDGKIWQYNSIGTIGPWCAVAFSKVTQPGKFLVLGGLVENSTALKLVSTGVTTKARAVVVAGRVSAIAIWEPGSGYTSTPVVSLTDPNNNNNVFLDLFVGNGVLASPTITVAGSGYTSTSTQGTVTGDGYKDQYQIGTSLVVSGLTRIPGPGDNVNISGINDYTYKLLTAQILSGSIGNYTARLTIAKDLNRAESPDHGTSMTIRQLYSQVRLTGHDFLDIGLGNFLQTNYPDTLFPNGTVVSPENEIRESNGGRVFYTSTDQDGNFRVGELFAVEQATGTVTLNAQFFALSGLEELRLGGFTVGGSGVVIREFSTDPTFTADSNNIVPTQHAILAYLNSRVSGGGSEAITGQLTAGIVRVGPDTITTTTGEELIFTAKVNFRGGIDGSWLAQSMFLSGGS